jgi:F0F1-type ATP synthase membrane subunit c/vacuolar-type H+-ATPase subunit K
MSAIQSPAAGAVLGATGVGNAANTDWLAVTASNPAAVTTFFTAFFIITFSPR